MGDEIKVKCSHHGGGFFGSVWAIGWLFTIGYLKLTFWKGALALIVWPYYLGGFLRK
jgi:hypothetical protein